MWSGLPAIMPSSEFITSAANPLLKDVRKALARGGLTTNGCCVAETFHLLEEALRSGCLVHTVIASEKVHKNAQALLRGRHDIRLITVSGKMLDATSDVATSQGVLALVEPPAYTMEQIFTPQSLVLILDGLQDPGNLGTIIRSAEAFGATGLILLKGTVSPFNPKALRASAGSIFRVPFVHGVEEAQAVDVVHSHDASLFAAVPNQTTHANLAGSCAIVIGSEGRGISPNLHKSAQSVSIPTAGVESLNAAISAAILLYEARRQRSL
jgi:TrmH family RNA methyltransferase